MNRQTIKDLAYSVGVLAILCGAIALADSFLPGPQGSPPVTSAAPSGAAGGSLTGTYPNPTLGSAVVTSANVNASVYSTNTLAAPAMSAVPLLRFYSADAIIGKNDGDTVSSWPDSSTNNVAATASATPIYKTNILNGKPILRFDGTKWFTSLATIPMSSGSWYQAAVMKWTTIGSNYQEIFEFYDRTDNKNFRMQKYTDDTVQSAGPVITNQVMFTASTAAWHLYEWVYDGNTMSVYIDGTKSYNAPVYPPNYTTTEIDFGTFSVDASFGFIGDCAEWYAMAAVPTPAQSAAIHSYVGSKYALTIEGVAPVVSSAAAPTGINATTTALWTNMPMVINGSQPILSQTAYTSSPSFTDKPALSVNGILAAKAYTGNHWLENSSPTMNTLTVVNTAPNGFSAVRVLDANYKETGAWGYSPAVNSPWGSADGCSFEEYSCAANHAKGGQHRIIQTGTIGGGADTAYLRAEWKSNGDYVYYNLSAAATQTLNANGNITLNLGTLTGSVVITGTTTNDSAASGKVGEIISSAIASGSAISLTTATPANVTTISLTAGDWDVDGNINFSATTATVTGTQGGIGTTSATLPTDGTEVYSGVQVTVLSEKDSVTLPRKRISIASTTTVYLVAQSTFSAGSVAGFGSISARRIR